MASFSSRTGLVLGAQRGANKKGFGGTQRKEASKKRQLFILYLTGGHIRKRQSHVTLPSRNKLIMCFVIS
jgi:hypothetical protein